jgi:hypothetical protein
MLVIAVNSATMAEESGGFANKVSDASQIRVWSELCLEDWNAL